MSKPSRAFAKPLRDVVGGLVGDVFRRQGFTSIELVTRWAEIVGPEIAAHCEPVKVQWQRPASRFPLPASDDPAVRADLPGTLVLRVEGPAAIQIQHLAGVLCERINRFFGWRAVARIALRQAPLRRREETAAAIRNPDAPLNAAATLPEAADDSLKGALARLAAAIGQT